MTVADASLDTLQSDPFAPLARPRRRLGWIGGVFLALIACGTSAWAVHAHQATPAAHYITVAASTGDVAQSIDTTGTVQPLVQVQVSSQVSGRVQRVAVDFNSRVHQGDVIAELDPTPLRAQLDQTRGALLAAQGNLTRNQADLAAAEHALARAVSLRAQNINAQSDVDTARGTRDAARGAVAAAQGALQQARAVLTSAQTNLAFAEIRAPIDGIVITRAIDPGQTVAASLQAPTLFVIANDMSHMQVLADVQEAYIGQVRAGLDAEVRVDAYRGEVFHGTVREVRFAPTTVSGVVTYPAVIDVANPDGKLRPGMTATITIATARHEGVVRVPNAALRFRPSGGAPRTGARAGGSSNGARAAHASDPTVGRIYVLRDGVPTPVPVHIGLSDGSFTEVQGAGLAANASVVVEQTDAASDHARPASSTTQSPASGSRRLF